VLLTKEGLRNLMTTSATEEQYVNADEDERAQMKSYQKNQGKAMALIYDRMEDRYLNRILQYPAVHEIFRKLDTEYQLKSKVAMMILYDRWQSLKFHENGDLLSYV